MVTRKMALVVPAYVLSVAVLLFLSPAGTSAQEDGTCRACHCQFNNVEVLRQLIESTIRDILVNDTGSTQAIEERVINTLNTGTTSTQTLETRITNTVETNLGKLPVLVMHQILYKLNCSLTFSILDTNKLNLSVWHQSFWCYPLDQYI